MPPILHHFDMRPEDLPPISPLDLRKAWRAAHEAAETGLALEPSDMKGVSFRHSSGPESRFLFSDLDAACWAAAIGRICDLRTVAGISLLFRLLALIELMSKADWLRPYFSLRRKDEAILAPALLAAAAREPLSSTAGFDTRAFKIALGLNPSQHITRPQKQKDQPQIQVRDDLQKKKRSMKKK